MVLALLADRPQGGYELLNELEHRFAPNYRPSPGGVYPALAALRAEALIDQDKGRAPYRLTARGRRLLADKAELLAQIEARTRVALDKAASLQPVLARFASRVTSLSGRVDRSAVEHILDNAAKAIADLEVSSGA